MIHDAPNSLSPESRAGFERLLARLAARPPRVTPTTVEQFAAAAAAREAEVAPLVAASAEVADCTVREIDLGGVPAIEVAPPVLRDDHAVAYVHGGGFILLSARSTLPIAARVALASGRRVLSIDYPLAPGARWREITRSVATALEAIAQGDRASHPCAVVADSAGGAVATSAILQMIEKGAQAPAALVLGSTIADLTMSGDTILTLGDADLILGVELLRAGYVAYADPAEHTSGLVSPALARFPRAFPRTLLQVGTREMLLSDSVMLHRALTRDGCDARLEVYEGMPHSFNAALPDTEEARRALASLCGFVDEAFAAAR